MLVNVCLLASSSGKRVGGAQPLPQPFPDITTEARLQPHADTGREQPYGVDNLTFRTTPWWVQAVFDGATSLVEVYQGVVEGRLAQAVAEFLADQTSDPSHWAFPGISHAEGYEAYQVSFAMPKSISFHFLFSCFLLCTFVFLFSFCKHDGQSMRHIIAKLAPQVKELRKNTSVKA